MLDSPQISNEDISRYNGIDYCASWGIEDESYIIKLFSKIRHAARDKDFWNNKLLTDGFNDRLERSWNDHKHIIDENNNEFEPLDVVKATNKVVNDGLVRIAELVTGTLGLNNPAGIGSGLWTHLAVGSGQVNVSASDTQLIQEIARVSLSTDGFQSAAGTVMRFGGFFAPTLANCIVLESGVFDDPIGGAMFYRTVYPVGIQHTMNSDFFTCSHSIYQVSV